MYVKETHQTESPGEGPPVTTGPQRLGSEAHLHVCAPDNTSHSVPSHRLSTAGPSGQVCSWETRDSSGRQVHSKTSQSFHVGLGCFHQACLPSGSGMHCSWATLTAFSGSFPFSPDEILATCLLRLLRWQAGSLPLAPRGKPVPAPHLPHDGRAALSGLNSSGCAIDLVMEEWHLEFPLSLADKRRGHV